MLKSSLGLSPAMQKSNVKRIDAVFDTYIKQSIKTTTREKRTEKKRPIRKLIEHGDVPLPKVWSQFISLDAKKANLAEFLSTYMMEHGNLPHGCELMTGGGCRDHVTAKSTIYRDIADLRSNHEEADTRLILHAIHAVTITQCSRILVVGRDTDVLLLLIHFFGSKDVEVWMMSGTAHHEMLPCTSHCLKPTSANSREHIRISYTHRLRLNIVIRWSWKEDMLECV